MKNWFLFGFYLVYLPALSSQETAKIELIVDMQNEEISAEGVFVVGNFFNGEPEPLDDLGDGRWLYPARFTQGDTLYYKFRNGLNQEETINNESCLATNGTGRRMLVVPFTEVITTVESCYNACETCANLSTSITEIPNTPIKIYPNPVSDGNISWDTNSAYKIQVINIIDLSGRIVRHYSNVKGNSLNFEKSELLANMYFIQMINEVGLVNVQKIMIH